MDPNPKSFPILSYVIDRVPYLGPKFIAATTTSTEPSSFDIEQQSTTAATDHSSSEPHVDIVERFPQLKDPKVLTAMTKAVSEVAQTRSVLQTLGPRPDHEAVDAAKLRLSEIEAELSKSLEEIVLSPRPSDIDRLQWRAHLADKEQECRRKAEKEKVAFKSMVQLDEMHEAYDKLLKDAEDRLVKIYENADSLVEGAEGECLPVAEEVNEEVVGILQEASGKGMDCVNLSGRRLRFLPEAFGRIKCLRVLNLSNNQLEVSLIRITIAYF